MPFKSKAQERWAFATNQTFAKEWADKTPNFARLPEKKAKGKAAESGRKRKRRG